MTWRSDCRAATPRMSGERPMRGGSSCSVIGGNGHRLFQGADHVLPGRDTPLGRAHRPAREPRRGRAARPAGFLSQRRLRTASAAVCRAQLRVSGGQADGGQGDQRQADLAARPTHRPGSPRTAGRQGPAQRPDRTPRADPDHRHHPGHRPITSFFCEQEASSANRKRPRFGTATSGVDNSSAVRGRPWTHLDGSSAPCPPSTNGPALGHDGALRTRRARRFWSLQCTAHLLLRPGPTGRGLRNYHILATTPANGQP